MMMPSTMILTICISMVLKRNRGLSLDIGSRYDRAGLGGASKQTSQTKIFSHQWGLNPPTLPDKLNVVCLCVLVCLLRFVRASFASE